MAFRSIVAALSLADVASAAKFIVGGSDQETFTVSPAQKMLDFTDLGYYTTMHQGQQVQMHCHPDFGLLLFLWDNSGAGSFRRGMTFEGVGGPPLYRFEIPDIDAFLAGRSVSAGESFKYSSSYRTLSIQYLGDGGEMKVPDCTDYDPNKFCPGCYPMMEYLGLGFDITTDTIVNPGNKNGKQYVARLFGSETNIPWEAGSHVYSDNTVFAVVDRTTDQGSTQSYTCSKDIQKARSGELGIRGSYSVAKIESSVAMSTSETNSFEGSMARSETVMKKGLGAVNFKSNDSDHYMTYQLWTALSSVNRYCQTYPYSYDSTPTSYCYHRFVRDIIKKFGTHYVSGITVGGQVKFILETESSLEASERSKAVEAALCASVKGLKRAGPGGCVGASTDDTESESSSSSVSGYQLETIGPDASDICYTLSKSAMKCDFTAFADRVTDESAGLMGFHLKEISALFDSVQSNIGRSYSEEGGWEGLTSYVINDIFKRYIEEKATGAIGTGCGGGEGDDSASEIGSKLSLIGLLVSAGVLYLCDALFVQ